MCEFILIYHLNLVFFNRSIVCVHMLCRISQYCAYFLLVQWLSVNVGSIEINYLGVFFFSSTPQNGNQLIFRFICNERHSCIYILLLSQLTVFMCLGRLSFILSHKRHHVTCNRSNTGGIVKYWRKPNVNIASSG